MQDKRDNLTFQQWLTEVDRLLTIRIGLDHMDLEDFMSYDEWEGGSTPEEGAIVCLENDSIYSIALEEGEI